MRGQEGHNDKPDKTHKAIKMLYFTYIIFPLNANLTCSASKMHE